VKLIFLCSRRKSKALSLGIDKKPLFDWLFHEIKGFLSIPKKSALDFLLHVIEFPIPKSTFGIIHLFELLEHPGHFFPFV